MYQALPYIFKTLIVLLIGGWIFYAYGIPLLEGSYIGCSIRGRGCSTSFSIFATFLFLCIAVALGAVWRSYDRH